jgi:hypothetical protein
MKKFKFKKIEIFIEEDTVKVNPCRVIKEVTRHHCHVLIFVLVKTTGVCFSQTINGLIMAHAMKIQ